MKRTLIQIIAAIAAIIVFALLAGCESEYPAEPQGCYCPPEYIEWDDDCSCDDPSPPPYEGG